MKILVWVLGLLSLIMNIDFIWKVLELLPKSNHSDSPKLLGSILAISLISKYFNNDKSLKVLLFTIATSLIVAVVLTIYLDWFI